MGDNNVPANKKQNTQDMSVLECFTLLSKRLDGVASRGDVANLEQRMGERIAQNAREISQLQVEQDKNRNDMHSAINAAVSKAVDQKLATVQGGACAQAPLDVAKDKAFMRARASLRIWPVPINGEQSPEKAVVEYFLNNLKIPEETVSQLCFVEVKRMPPMRRGIVKDEIHCEFTTVEQRDLVNSYAPNLASMSTQGGIRLDVPDHLRGQFKILQDHFVALRTQHGEGVKKSIKLCDATRGVYMDVKLPSGTKWHRVDVAVAREARRKREERELREVRGQDPQSFGGQRPRAGNTRGRSVNQASMLRSDVSSPERENDEWTQGRFRTGGTLPQQRARGGQDS
jgi:hypothetical protein